MKYSPLQEIKKIKNADLCIDRKNLNPFRILCNEKEIFCLYNETDKVICSWKNFDEFLFTETKRLELLYLQHPWGWLDIKSNTLPVGHKDKN